MGSQILTLDDGPILSFLGVWGYGGQHNFISGPEFYFAASCLQKGLPNYLTISNTRIWEEVGLIKGNVSRLWVGSASGNKKCQNE